MDFTEIAAAGRMLVESGFSQPVVTRALAKVGVATPADRVYVFENAQIGNALVFNMRYEWSTSQVEMQLDNPEMQGLQYDVYGPSWPAIFLRGESIASTPSTVNKATRRVMEDQAIKSMLFCPIMVNTQWWGFVGFDDCTTDRQWSDRERAMLSALARVLAGSLKHARIREQAEATRAATRAAMDQLARLSR